MKSNHFSVKIHPQRIALPKFKKRKSCNIMQLCPPIPRTLRFQTAQNTGEKKRKIEPLSRRVGKSVNTLRQHITKLPLPFRYQCYLSPFYLVYIAAWQSNSNEGSGSRFQGSIRFWVPCIRDARVPDSQTETTEGLLLKKITRYYIDDMILQVYGRIRQSCFAMLCLSQIPGLILSGDPTK